MLWATSRWFSIAATSYSDVAHLYNRIGFGAGHADIVALQALDWPTLVERVLDTSAATSPSAGVPTFPDGNGSWRNLVEMIWFWLERCRTSHAPLVEKMVLFWHGHLTSSSAKVHDKEWLFDQNQLFRTHGLGSFEQLLQRASVQPAMLRYLDNNRNSAGRPNDNFARELMELFTLGVGNYTEDDVAESARAWTGHSIDKHTGAYRFIPEAHDWGNKTFFGDTRNWDGPNIIDHIVNGPKSDTVARFIATKLWSFLAYPDPEAAVIDSVASAFRSSGMEIRALVRAILLHPQFRSTRAKQGLIRSPIEYVVAVMRATGLDAPTVHPEWALKSMGQQPFYPPNVSGWKQNEYWVNSAATWAKARFASYVRWKLFHNDELANSNDLSPHAAVDAALTRFNLIDPSASTRNALIEYVVHERAHTRWGERAGLLMLPMLTPEIQVA
ncbi:MAG: DUF1800 domain-containing protein [Actinomycetota bacterium]